MEYMSFTENRESLVVSEIVEASNTSFSIDLNTLQVDVSYVCVVQIENSIGSIKAESTTHRLSLGKNNIYLSFNIITLILLLYL